MSRSARWPAVVAGVAAVAFLATLAAAPQTLLLALASDDAFYYFKIARNIVNGAGCSFDGLAPTNGFHPLWMVCLLPIYTLVPESLVLGASLSLGLSVLIGIATLYGLYGLVERHLAPGWGWLTIALCCLPNMLSALSNGMETALQLAAVTFVLHQCCRHKLLSARATPPESFLLGVMLGVVALCRLDSAFLVIAVGLLTLLALARGEQSLQRGAVRIAAVGCGVALALAPFFAWNVLSFGHLMPISGSVKSAMPALRRPLTIEEDMVLGLALLVVIAILLVAASGRRGGATLHRPTRSDSPILMLAVASGLHYLHAFLFLTWGVYWWHFTLYGLTIALLVPVVLRGMFDRPDQRVRWMVAIPLVLLGLGLQTRAGLIKHRQHSAWFEGVAWARLHTAPGTIFGLKDAGLFGYFSDRPVINLDGKANGYTYRDHLLGGSVDDYLAQVGTEYIAHITSRYDQEDRVWIPLARPNQDFYWLRMPRTAEVFRSASAPGKTTRIASPRSSHFAIWSYRPPEKSRGDG